MSAQSTSDSDAVASSPAITPRIGPTRVPRPLLAACACAAVGAGLFAFRISPRLESSVPEVQPPAAMNASREIAALDAAAFRVPIWVADPPPPPPPSPPPPPAPVPPLKLQLLAIVNEDGALRAILYDPDTDHLHIVADGQSVAGRTVERVGTQDVALRDERGMQTLSLAGAGGAGGAGGTGGNP